MKIQYFVALAIAGIVQAKTIEATIVTERGEPVTIAVVNFHATGSLAPPTGALAGRTPDKGGKLTADVSDAESWQICASAPAQKLLDSCLWQDDLPNLSDAVSTASRIAPGGAKVSATITLHPGVAIQFRVDDPKSLLAESAPNAKIPDAKSMRFMRVGVISAKGHYFQAYPIKASSTSTTYEVLVPEGISLIVSFSSYNLAITDTQGRIQNSSNSERFISSSEEAAKVRAFNISIPSDGVVAPPSK